MTKNFANPKLKALYYLFIATAILPLLVTIPVGFLTIPSSPVGPTESFFLTLAIIPIIFYFYIANKKMTELNFTATSSNEHYSTEMSVGFYLCFLIFMISILFSFNLLITGYFLANGQVPMGMNVTPEDAVLMIAIGIYALVVGLIGTYYLVHSKRILRPKKTTY